MAVRLRSFFLGRARLLVQHISAALLILMGCAPLWAADVAPPAEAQEQVIQPGIERREIKLAKIDTEDWEIGVFGGMMSIEDFGTNPVMGARIAYHITEGLFVEGAYGVSTGGETSYEVLSGSAQLLTDKERELSYYNISLGYNILPGEAFLSSRLAYTTDFYLIGGVGSTTFAGDDRYTVNVGTGFRFLLTDWLSMHVDMRDHIFDIDVLGTSKTTQNLEMSAGIAVFF